MPCTCPAIFMIHKCHTAKRYWRIDNDFMPGWFGFKDAQHQSDDYRRFPYHIAFREDYISFGGSVKAYLWRKAPSITPIRQCMSNGAGGDKRQGRTITEIRRRPTIFDVCFLICFEVITVIERLRSLAALGTMKHRITVMSAEGEWI